MYYRYFGLKEAPFSIAVNPRYLFMSARHRDALAHLLYGVGVGGGFILLTGEVGTGKTTINRCLLEQLPENTDIALILNPALNAVELLATVCDELDISYEEGEQSLKVLTDKLHQFLLTNHAKGRNTVLLIDEAQHLEFSVLEQIRLLTNLETNTKKLLQIVLVGQPELRTILNQPELRQLAQRITARYQLKPLTLAETRDYIRHRLQVAGLPASQQLFPRSVTKGIHRVSRGIPRIINVLCDRLLLGTYGQNKTIVDRRMLKQAITEVMGEEEDIKLAKPIGGAATLLAIAAVVIVAVTGWQWQAIVKQFDKLPIAAAEPITPALPTTLTPEPELKQPSQAAPPDLDLAIISPPVLQLIDTEQQAINELLRFLQLGDQVPDTMCNDDSLLTLRCERLTAKSWQALQEYNRTVVLSLITKAKMQAYVTLVAVTDTDALLSNEELISSVPLATLGEIWTGDFILIWQAPELFTKAFAEEHSGPMIRWLAERFAQLDGQKKLLAYQRFTPELSARIKIFQRDNHLNDDGVVGLKTLLKLNEQLGIAKTLDSYQAPQPMTLPPVDLQPASSEGP